MITAHALAKLLLEGPDVEVTTWDPVHREPNAVEQVIATDAFGVVLGMELTGSVVDGAGVIWTAHDTARRGLVKAAAQCVTAKREWVG